MQKRVKKNTNTEELFQEELFQVYWIDLTIPGYNYNRSALQALGLLSAGLAAHPERSAGIVFAPNTGPYGMEYTDHGMRKAIQELETMMEDTSMNVVDREFDLFFDPDTIPKQSRRLGRHKGWIVLSNQCSSADDKYTSLFLQSHLWVRTSIVNVPMTPSKLWVNPLQGVRGALDPAKDLPVREAQAVVGRMEVGEGYLGHFVDQYALDPCKRCQRLLLVLLRLQYGRGGPSHVVQRPAFDCRPRLLGGHGHRGHAPQREDCEVVEGSTQEGLEATRQRGPLQTRWVAEAFGA